MLLCGGASGENDREPDRKGKKKVPAGGSHVGTKVGVWEACSLAQNSKAVGSRSDSSRIFLANFFAAIFAAMGSPRSHLAGSCSECALTDALLIDVGRLMRRLRRRGCAIECCPFR